MLVGRSLHQIKQMISDVRSASAEVGLHLHPEKTKIQHSNIGYGSRVKSAKIDGMDVEVLEPTETTMYLGRALSLTNVHDSELKHRIAKAWAKFGVYRQELTDREIPLRLRLKLFQSVVTPSVLYGSSSWVLTGAREQTLRSTQLEMLRAMLGRKRSVVGECLETWVDWVRRATAEARAGMDVHRVPDCVTEQANRV